MLRMFLIYSLINTAETALNTGGTRKVLFTTCKAGLASGSDVTRRAGDSINRPMQHLSAHVRFHYNSKTLYAMPYGVLGPILILTFSLDVIWRHMASLPQNSSFRFLEAYFLRYF